MPRNSKPSRKHLTGRSATKPQKTPHYITLREAGAMLINPANPAAAYAELEAAVDRTLQAFHKTRAISYIAGITALVAVATSATFLILTRHLPYPGVQAGVLGLAALTSVAFHPLTVAKTFIGGIIIPPEPEPVRDLLARLGRGEFAAHYGDDNEILVDVEDIKTVIADRAADVALPGSKARTTAPRRTKPRDFSGKLNPDPMPAEAEIVDPDTIAQLNECASGAYIKINDAYGFIIGNGDRHKGAAELRRLERQSNSVIRQPGDQYMKVGRLRAFLKEKGQEDIKGSPWDAMT
jgi:hypothetical protein